MRPNASSASAQTINIGTTGSAIANAGTSVTIQQGNSTTLTASGGGTYLWDNGATSASITVSPTVTTTYCVVANNGNCTDSACVTVFVDSPTLSCDPGLLSTLLPNAFSPNNDGQNDQLCVPNNACIVKFNLKIFDRWGEKVFETESLSNCWNGAFQEKGLNTGVFVFFLEAELSTGDNFEQKGNISLIK